MNKVLILGGSGLLGSSLASYFLKRKFQVGILSRTISNYKNNNVKSYQVDILEYKDLEQIFREYDVVINCIGQITKPSGLCLQLNTKGIDKIIKAVRLSGIHLIHISTVSVYGTSKIANEENELNPESIYGAIKCFAEFQIKQNLENYVILRVSNLFGITQTKGILAYILRTYKNREKDLYFDNKGTLKRHYLHVDDLSIIIGRVLDNHLIGVYNVVGDDFFNIKELINIVENTLNYSFSVHYEDNEPIENIESIQTKKILQGFKYKSIVTYLKEIKDVIN